MDTFEDILARYGMNFGVKKVPQWWHDGTNPTNPVFHQTPAVVAALRTDDNTFLATVGENYGLTPYDKSFEFCKKLIENGVQVIDGAVTRNGARAFLFFRGASSFEIAPGDRIENVFYIIASHDMSSEIEVKMAPRRTKTGQLMPTDIQRNKFKFRFRHSSQVQKHLDKAEATLAHAQADFEDFEESVRSLSLVKLTPHQAKTYYETIFGEYGKHKRTDNIIDEMMKKYQYGVDSQIPAFRGTMFGAYMAIVQWAEERKVKRPKRISERDARIESALIGDAAKKKLVALSTAYGMVEAFGGFNQ